MRLGRGAVLAWLVAGLSLLFLVASLVLDPHAGDDLELLAISPLVVLGYGGVGALIATRSRARSVGWLLLAVALGFALTSVGDAYGVRGLIRDPGSVPAVEIGPLVSTVALVPFLAAIPLILLLYPTGVPPSPRWRTVLWAMIGFPLLGLAGFLINPGPVGGTAQVPNPIGIESAKTLVAVLLTVGGVGSFGAGLACVAALVVRFRRSRGEERQQMRWLAYSAAAAAVVLLAALATDVLLSTAPTAPDPFLTDAFFAVFITLMGVGFPVAIGIAILRYRLYDIDLVINKTLVYASLAGFITAVYVGVVVGMGSLIGRGDEPNLGLSILATAVVAVAFAPVRERTRHLANRLVYGKRATPYEVLSQFSHRMGESYATEDLLPRMARILHQGTGARQAVVWLRVGGQLVPEVAWPREGELPSPLSSSTLEGITESEAFLPVIHRGETLGALSIAKSPGDPLRPAESNLVRDLASGAGLVLRNVRLIEELKASRRRLVQAQDQERRRLERNIHDGAQQQLVALQVKLGLARTLASKDLERTEAMLTELQAETQAALEDLRDLARGIYPPLLADKGLAAALESQARRAAIPVEVVADSIGRYPPEAEAAVYFSVLEALQNVAKYAGASRATVGLSGTDGHVTFEVSDDGVGFDPETTSYGTGLQGMADRLEALGGSLGISSSPGEGTRVTGRLPVRAGETMP